MRVLHVIHSLDRGLGGLATAVLGVCDGLKQAAISVDLWAGQGPRDSLDYLADEFPALSPSYFPRSFPARYGNSAALVREVATRGSNYDLVELHAVFSLCVLRVGAVCRRHGIPYVIRPHGSLDPFDLCKHARLKEWFGPRWVAPYLRGAKGVLCTSPIEAQRMEDYGANPQRLVVPLPVPQRVQNLEGAGDFRQRWGIPPQAFVVLFLSRVDYKKGLEYLLPALARLKTQYPELWFVLAGDGDRRYGESIGRLLKDLNMEGWTRKTGFLSGPEKLAAFAAADRFALASQNENFGIVVVEALQAGLPVVISNEVYIHEAIAARGGAEICQPSTTSCFQALERSLTLPIPRPELRARASQIAEELFSVPAATESLLKLYAAIV